MADIASMTERQAWLLIDRLRHAHGIASSSTPAGILLQHPDADTDLSLSLWDSREDLAALLDWMRAAGLETT